MAVEPVQRAGPPAIPRQQPSRTPLLAALAKAKLLNMFKKCVSTHALRRVAALRTLCRLHRSRSVHVQARRRRIA